MDFILNVSLEKAFRGLKVQQWACYKKKYLLLKVFYEIRIKIIFSSIMVHVKLAETSKVPKLALLG